MRICHGEYRKKGYRFCEISHYLDNLSEYQIEALSNLLRVEVTNDDCFISRPTGSEKSAVYQFIFPFALYEAFQLLISNDVYVEKKKTQEIVISNM
jgi:antitoxin component of MazEF toxin-antitoxin module